MPAVDACYKSALVCTPLSTVPPADLLSFRVRFVDFLKSAGISNPDEDILNNVERYCSARMLTCSSPDMAHELYQVSADVSFTTTQCSLSSVSTWVCIRMSANAPPGCLVMQAVKMMPGTSTRKHLVTQHGLNVNGPMFPGAAAGPVCILMASDDMGRPCLIKLVNPLPLGARTTATDDEVKWGYEGAACKVGTVCCFCLGTVVCVFYLLPTLLSSFPNRQSVMTWGKLCPL